MFPLHQFSVNISTMTSIHYWKTFNFSAWKRWHINNGFQPNATCQVINWWAYISTPTAFWNNKSMSVWQSTNYCRHRSRVYFSWHSLTWHAQSHFCFAVATLSTKCTKSLVQKYENKQISHAMVCAPIAPLTRKRRK